MSDRQTATRRGILRAATVAGVVGLAGCAGGTDGGTSGTDAGTATSTPTATGTATSDDEVVEVTAGPTDTSTGSGGSSEAGESGESGGSGEAVGMTCYTSSNEYFFRPAVIRVPVGGTVSFGVASTCRQQTLAFHPDNDLPLRIPEGVDPWSSDVMQGSGTFEHTFDREGVYDYAGLHDDFGQVGTVVAGDPDPEGQPGLAPPQESIPEAAREELTRLNGEVRSLLSE